MGQDPTAHDDVTACAAPPIRLAACNGDRRDDSSISSPTGSTAPERLLRLQERRLGAEHAALAMVLYNLGWIAREQKRPPAARAEPRSADDGGGEAKGVACGCGA